MDNQNTTTRQNVGTFAVENAAGGDYREFRLTRLGGLSAAAIAHISQIGYMGPVFSGPAGEQAAMEWRRDDQDE